MNISKTDTRELLRLLDESSKIISANPQQSTKEANIARRCRRLRKKIAKKADEQQLSTPTSRSSRNSGLP